MMLGLLLLHSLNLSMTCVHLLRHCGLANAVLMMIRNSDCQYGNPTYGSCGVLWSVRLTKLILY